MLNLLTENTENNYFSKGPQYPGKTLKKEIIKKTTPRTL